jgi:hypothetical protein
MLGYFHRRQFYCYLHKLEDGTALVPGLFKTGAAVQGHHPEENQLAKLNKTGCDSVAKTMRNNSDRRLKRLSGKKREECTTPTYPATMLYSVILYPYCQYQKEILCLNSFHPFLLLRLHLSR